MENKNQSNCNVLNSLITIGDYNPNSVSIMNAKEVIGECIDIKIKDSYKDLTNTAVVTLPREVIADGTIKDENGHRVRTMLNETSVDSSSNLKLAKSVFKRGQRITISIGYDDNIKTLFDGFIVSIDSKTPFRLHCEDFGWHLKKTALPAIHVNSKKGVSVNEIMEKALEGTGIALNSQTKKMDIRVGHVNVYKSNSIGEVLESWKREYGLMSFIKFEGGKPTLALSRTYFSVNRDKTLIDGEPSSVPVAYFDYNVAKDNLRFLYLDYDTLALECTLLLNDKKNSRYRVTLRLNKNYPEQLAKYNVEKESAKNSGVTFIGETPDEFELINETHITKKEAKELAKKSVTLKDNIATIKDVKERINIAEYNVRTYHAFNIDKETFIKNAKAKFKEISQTGIEGDLTLFGDFGLTSSQMIRLYDRFNPEKNGLYVISEVISTFGVRGYRQKIQIPYKRSN